MPRWLSRSSGSSAIGSIRIDALRVCKIDRADRESLGHQSARAFRGHADHGGDTAERFERKPLDRLLIGNDVVVAGGQQAIDAPDPERMFEGDTTSRRERTVTRAMPFASSLNGRRLSRPCSLGAAIASTIVAAPVSDDLRAQTSPASNLTLAIVSTRA
jgi:hypothetical protein